MNKTLEDTLTALKLSWIRENIDEEVAIAVRKNRSPHELIERLLEGELATRNARAVERRIRQAKLSRRPTLVDFDFNWPQKINADQIRHLFSLDFIKNATNVVFIGNVGLGKSHLAEAIAVQACEHNINALFAPATTIINELADAQQLGIFTKTLNRYLRPTLLIIDELGYLPVDKLGAELLFQVLAGRYEKASTIITTNRIYKEWNKTFANDNAMTAAVLDRVVHHCETIIIEGQSYRLKDRVNHQ
jgi:DNA replication protein DnaC